MEWLTQMLGMANQGSSPFGALGGSGGGLPPGGGASPLPFMGPNGQPSAAPGGPPGAPPGAAPGAAPQMGGAGGLPGLLGSLLSRGQQPQPQQGQPGQPQPGAGGNQLMSQAMALMKQPQLQQPQWMPWMSQGR